MLIETTLRPNVITPVLEGIPQELRDRPQWVLWKYLPPKFGKDKWRKVPHYSGGFASTTNPDTWAAFADVWTIYLAGGYDGIGYVFTSDDPYVGIDWDHSFDSSEWKTKLDVEPWLTRLNSYTELSASGTGVHVLIKATYPFDTGRKSTSVEIYKQRRFFTVTGYVFEGLPAEPQEAQAAFDDLVRANFPDKLKKSEHTAVFNLLSFDDSQIVERCRRARNSSKFLSLWEGRWEQLGEYGSQSEAEYALLGILRFWTQDGAQLDRLMRSSGLRRAKWDSKRGDGTYGSRSIGNILSGTGAVYSPGPQLILTHNNSKESPPVTVEEIIKTIKSEADTEEDEEESEEVFPGRYTLHWLSEAFGPDDPVDWVVAGLFQRGSINLLHGAPGTKKTYALLDLAMCMIDGKNWLGRETAGGTVLLIDEESGPKRLKRRLREVASGHDVASDGRLAYTTLEMFDLLNSNADLGYVEEIIEETKATLVIIDALADVMPGGDENEVKDTHPVFQKLKLLAHRYNCCVIVIHHSNKGGKYRGSSAIPGVVDVMIKLSSPSRSVDLTFTIEKNRDGEEDEFAAQIVFDQQMQQVRLVRSAVTLTTSFERKSIQHVLEFLANHDGGGYMEDIIKAPAMCSPNAARQAVYDLVEQGRLIRTDGGTKGKRAFYETFNA